MSEQAGPKCGPGPDKPTAHLLGLGAEASAYEYVFQERGAEQRFRSVMPAGGAHCRQILLAGGYGNQHAGYRMTSQAPSGIQNGTAAVKLGPLNQQRHAIAPYLERAR